MEEEEEEEEEEEMEMEEDEMEEDEEEEEMEEATGLREFRSEEGSYGVGRVQVVFEKEEPTETRRSRGGGREGVGKEDRRRRERGRRRRAEEARRGHASDAGDCRARSGRRAHVVVVFSKCVG